MEDLKPYEVMIPIKHFKCQKCGHTWIPKRVHDGGLPPLCPHCNSATWTRPRRPKPAVEAQKIEKS